MIQPYATSIKNCLVKLAASGSAKTRAAALEALSTLLDIKRAHIDVSDFNIQDMFTQFSRDFSLPVSKTPASVKGSILELLGVIIRYHYKTIKQGDIAQVVRWSFITLREQLFTNKPAENAILRGILGGLDHLLSCEIIELDTEQTDLLYKSVRTLFNIPGGLARYEAPLAALTMFSNHVATFEKYIVQDSQVLYKELNKLCGHQNRNVSSMGYRSMENFLKEVSKQLSAKQPGKQERVSFNFFMDIFIRTLRQKIDEVSFRELSVAIRGIGYFSRAFDKFLTSEEIDALREYLVKISSWFYSAYNKDHRQMAAHLPAFIQAYTYFAASQTNITPTFMSTMVKLINVFVYSYIRLNTITRSTGLYAIRDLLQALYYKGEGTLRSFLSAFLYETLIATCTDDQSGSYEGQESYIEFIYFWKTLLNAKLETDRPRKRQKHQKRRQEEAERTVESDSETDIESDNEMDVDDDDNSNNGDGQENEDLPMDLQAILFDEFLTAFLRLVKTFNLDLTRKEDGIDTAAISSEDSTSATNAAIEGIATPNMLQAVNEQHFVIFQNAVEFWCMLLPKLHTHRLRDWTYLAASALIDLSLRRPLVSGFYKMLAAMLSVAHRRKLFEGYKSLYAAQQQRKQLGAICDISETQTDMFSAFVIFRDFLREAWHRVQQFKDELLASCLRAILAYPLAFFDVHELVLPIRTAFRLGLTVYSLSDTALDVLYELTNPDAPNQDLTSFFSDILPSMNEYLLMDLGSKEDKNQPNTDALKKWNPTTRAQRKQEKYHYKPEQEALGTVQAESVTSLRDVQLRVVRFLGRIGGANKLMLKDKNSNQTRNDDSKEDATSVYEYRQQLLAWDPDRQLKIRLPFPNANIDVTMDEMLPRICELAESSPDRQVKVAACELLHGLVLSMIGDSAFRARDSTEAVQSRYHKVYIRVFPILLRLAIDVETIARDMFSTLVRQLIHWFTNNAQYENPETVALLQACIDAACSTDAGLRDYGADCIQEFALWSIRQQDASGTRENSPMNIKSLLKRVYNLASNPSSRQRLGACIIFNRIYRTFREEDALVNEFTLELLYWIFFSLKLAEEDHPLIGTLDQAKEAITHIKRIIMKKLALFNTVDNNRRRFPGIEEEANLAAIVGWTFDQTAQTQREYARECMKFFEQFVGHITGVKSGKEWLAKRLREKGRMLQDRFETNRLRPTNIDNKNGLLWLRQLRSALDGYLWLLEHKMVTLPFLLELEPSSWTEACVYLLDHSPEDIFGRQNSIEKTKAQALYAYAYYQLVAVITEAGSTGSDPQSKETVEDHLQAESVLETFVARGILTHETFVSMVVQFLLLPNQYVEAAKAEQGSIANKLSDEMIRKLVRKFLRLMTEQGPGKFMRLFNKTCSTVLYSRNVDLTNLQLNQSALNDMLQIVDGIKILQDLDLFDDVCKAASESSGGARSAHDYCAALLDKFVQYSSTTEPVWIELVGEILVIAFHQPGFAAKYATQLLLENSSTYADRLATYQRFNAYINDCIAMNFKHFAPVLISHANDSFIHEVVIGLVTYLRTERSAHKDEISQFVDQLLSETTFLDDIIKAWGNDSNVADLIKFLTGLLGADSGIPIRTKGQPIFSTLCEALQVCLAPGVSLAIKIEAFELIPVFITVSGEHIDKIAKAVDDTVRRQLNYRSTDLDPSTTVYREYVDGLEKLLEIMSQFSALWMFEILFPVFIQEDNHTHNDIIQMHISKYARRLGPTDFKKTVSICFNFYKDEKQRMDWRRAAINLIISLHALVPEGHVVTFYMDNIRYIMSIVLREALRRGSDQEVMDDMEERMCCFRLMQSMYEKLPAVEAHTKTSKIVEVYVGKPLDEHSGRKLMTDLITHLSPVVKEKEAPSSNPSINETRLHYHRVAYNTMTAAIMRTQKSATIFSGYLLPKPIWENIVDTTEDISLPAALDKRMEQERVVEYKRRSDEREKEEQDASIKYMASIQMTTNSLTQASLTDMALASLGFSADSAENDTTGEEANDNSPFSEDEEQITIDRSRDKGMMEKDQISSNPCMKSIMVIIRRLYKIAPANEDKSMPDWIRNFLKAFTAQGTPLQVRLFFAKAVYFESDPFEPYAEYWIRPLMQLAKEADKYGDPINYMALDICAIVMLWGVNNKMRDTYEDRYLLYEFVDYFMKHGYNKNTQVQRKVVNVLKGAFENWKKQIIVPTRTVYNEIVTQREGRGDELGLQLVGIALAHDMDPFYDGPEVKLEGLTEEEFYRGISTNLWNSYAEVHSSAAEILGWAVELKKKRGNSTEYLEKLIDACINRMDPFGTKKSKYTSEARFLRCIQRIQIHDKDIAKNYLNKVLYLIPQLYGDLKIIALRIIAGASEDIPDLFKSIQSKKLLKTLTRGDDQGQILLLTTLEKIAKSLTLPQIDHAVNTISNNFVNHANSECRRLFYKFMQSVNDVVKAANDQVLGDKIKVFVLQGMVDPDNNIRNTATSYIKTSYGIQDDIYNRLKAVMGDMYMPEIESQYLLYSTEMILDTTKQGDDYETPIFKDALPNARFDAGYTKIDTSWQLRNPMTPLFVATQDQSLNSQGYLGGVRATQTSFQFSLTQSAATQGPSLASTFSSSVFANSMDIDSSTAADESQQATNDYRSAVGRSPSKKKSFNKYQLFNQRAYNPSQNEEALHFSDMHDRRRKRARRAEQLQKQAREKKVQMIRDYRMGDLPDVQIKHFELVLPLQVLGRSDNDIARMLYAVLASTIADHGERLRGKTGYRNEIAQIAHENLEKSKMYFPPAIGSFLRINYEIPTTGVSTAVVNTCSQRSFNQNIAIALIERQFLYHVEDKPKQPSKKARTTKTPKLGHDKKQWIDLAQLYKSVDQPEIFQNLYQAHVASVSTSKEAIDAEIQNRYADAANLFVELYDNYKDDVDPEERNLWMQELLNCYEQLTEWQDMAATVSDKFNNNFEAIWDDSEKDEYIKYFMRSYTKLRQGLIDNDGEFTPWTDERPNPVFDFVGSANKVPERMQYLLHHVACDVSQNAIWKSEYDRARFYTRESYDSLLSIWTSLHPLAYGSRMAQLAVLERTVELEEFLDVVSDLQRSNAGRNQVESYMRGLLKKFPDNRLDAMDVWDDITDSRYLFLDELEGMRADLKERIPDQNAFNDCKKSLLKSMISAARQQNNVNVASTRFRQLDLFGISKEEKTVMQLENRLLLVPTLKNDAQLSTIARMINIVIKNEGPITRSQHKNDFLLAAADTFEYAKTKLQEDPDEAFTALMSSSSLVNLLSKHKFKNAAMLSNYLNSTACQYLQDVYVATMDADQSIHLACLWKLADYCDNALVANEEESSKVKIKIDTELYSRIVIDNYFRAMELGKKEAIERFPRLLDLIERYPENGPEFKSKAESFGPTWMYIRWIPQMVAIMDNPIAVNVFPALHHLALSYPNAIYYAFNISNEHFKAIGDKLDETTRNHITKLANALYSSMREKFITELRRLTNPEHIVKDFAGFLETVLYSDDISREYVQNAYNEFNDLVMNSRSSEMGEIPKDFAVLNASYLRDCFGTQGSKLFKMTRTQIQNLRAFAEKAKKSSKNPDRLGSYSPFLAEFQGTEWEENIEIPGQYSGFKQPHPEDHAKVASFDERLLVMSSMRAPKRLRIYGTDEKKHDFLIKGGEDLRLDQRLQQLFTVMNEILQEDPYCARHNVNIRTYKVVPMSTTVGMIEWVADTMPLQSCLDSIDSTAVKRTKTRYNNYIDKYRPRGASHGFIYTYSADRDKIVENYESSASLARQDMLRDYFLRLAASPEAFLYIREDFVHSLAAVSISGYVLGIGDRHLDNFLVDLNSGQLVPIDFGYAFGAATEMLPYPELMPFRLTKQLTGVCEPVGVSGMLETPMIHILQALQDKKSTLLNTMDVFIKEPLLDWRKEAIIEAKRQKQRSGSIDGGGNTGRSGRSGRAGAATASNPSASSTTSTARGSSSEATIDQEIAWYPQQKLDTARNKLSLENPGYTMAKDVSRNKRVLKMQKDMAAVTRGDPKHNIRARVGERCSTVQEQVRCLIDLATDPAILGRTWVGWSPLT
ncbi:hypothetical protein BDB00DRAFT_874560 [Zychaea mexicana]|uniref:uncharacterized protein n=1 Tax=Zychaea mexicana TaxID=64656 RepID=UPI0022FEDC3E|nr:uncharacterized protein BDB00DRAFT_874560 [Zychaea mexicana]KAI9491166.1 hypothetical protein BDB00DRAFT_874560 [Zychaea mexicana]